MNNLDLLLEFVEEIPVGIVRNNTAIPQPNYYNDYLLKMLGWSSDELDTMQKWFVHVYPDEVYRQYVIEL